MKELKTIGIAALAGGAIEKEKIDIACSFFRKLGYRIKLSNNIYNNDRYFAGNDNERLSALYQFFIDNEVDIIINARGGYGSIRLLNQIDYNIIKNHPKIFCGYSDITALLLMIYKKTGLVTFHAPMACSDFGEKSPSLTTINNFFKAIKNEKLAFNGTKIFNDGTANGIIWGGNLSTVASLCGLDFIPDKDFIFFAEDLNEPVYKIDKMFTQLFNIESFTKHCKGIVLGEFLSIDNNDMLESLFYEFPVPTVGGFQITHGKDKITIPIGRKAILTRGQLVIN